MALSPRRKVAKRRHRKCRRHLKFQPRKQIILPPIPQFSVQQKNLIHHIQDKMEDVAAQTMLNFEEVEANTRSRAESLKLVQELKTTHETAKAKIMMYYEQELDVAFQNMVKEQWALVYSHSNDLFSHHKLLDTAQCVMKDDLKYLEQLIQERNGVLKLINASFSRACERAKILYVIHLSNQDTNTDVDNNDKQQQPLTNKQNKAQAMFGYL